VLNLFHFPSIDFDIDVDFDVELHHVRPRTDLFGRG
jgi:hypothetical protein